LKRKKRIGNRNCARGGKNLRGKPRKGPEISPTRDNCVWGEPRGNIKKRLGKPKGVRNREKRKRKKEKMGPGPTNVTRFESLGKRDFKRGRGGFRS